MNKSHGEKSPAKSRARYEDDIKEAYRVEHYGFRPEAVQSIVTAQANADAIFENSFRSFQSDIKKRGILIREEDLSGLEDAFMVAQRMTIKNIRSEEDEAILRAAAFEKGREELKRTLNKS